ncbi:hypothetical protein MGH68_13865 [Erysipelothrix sp. D19-032]
MNKLIDKYFYDKSIDLYTSEKGISIEGGRKKSGKNLAVRIMCNANPTSNRLLKENFGIDIDASLMITCSPDLEIKKGYTFSYKGIDYEVVEILPHDSHQKVLCR